MEGRPLTVQEENLALDQAYQIGYLGPEDGDPSE